MKDSWREYRIGELVDLSQGQVINAQTNHLVVSEGIPLLRITDMLNGTKTVFIDAERVATKNVAKPDDIIYTRTGQVGLVFKNQFGVVHNNSFKVIPKDERLDRQFLYWFLKTNAIYEYVNGVASGSAQPDLPHGSFKSISIKLPPLPTQQRIASILSAYDDLIEVNNQRIKLLEQTARELYKEWFVRMRFPGYKQAKFVKGVPEGWEVKPISAIVKFLSGYSFKSSFYTANGKFGVVTIKNVQDGHFISDCSDYVEALPKNLKEYCILKTGDVLMSLTGNVGRVCHVIGDNILLNQRVAKLKPLISDKTHYIYCFFRENSMIQYMENISLGSTAQMNLSPIQLGKQKVIVPDSHLIKRFDEMVDPYFQNKYQLIRANEMLREIRDRLLPRLISGKLQVKEPTNKKAVMA
jgi:type I restriction enzyme S subunit